MINFDLKTLKDRIIRAGKLDVKFYEEISTDDTALGQSLVIIAGSSLAAGIGGIGKFGWSSILFGTFINLASWFLWVYIIYILGTKVARWSGSRVSFLQLLSTLGFSASPGLLRILGLVPFTTDVIFVISAIWMLIAVVVAARLALDYRRMRQAVIICVGSWIIQLLIILILFSLFLKIFGVLDRSLS